MIEVKYGNIPDLGITDNCLIVQNEQALMPDIKIILQAMGFKALDDSLWMRSFHVSVADILSNQPEFRLSDSVLGYYDKIMQKSHEVTIGQFPDLFHKDMLMDYQIEDIRRSLYTNSMILGHEMGLGKTAISLACAEKIGKRTVVACQSGAKFQWAGEIETFTDSDYFVVENGRSLEGVNKLDLYGKHYIIVSYDMLKNPAINTVVAPYVKDKTLIVDEVTEIKNRQTGRSQMLRALKPMHVFSLSGTPLENNLLELKNISDITFPGLFPSKDIFSQLFLIREKKGEFWRTVGEKNLHVMRKIMPHLLIRRNIDDTIPLPPYEIKEVQAPMSLRQLEIESLLFAQARVAAQKAMLRPKRFKHKKVEEGEEAEESEPTVLTYHTFAIENAIDPTMIPIENLSKYPDQNENLLASLALAKEEAGISPRIQAALDIIKAHEGEKIVIFSMFKKALNILAENLHQPLAFIEGGKQTKKEIAKFRDGQADILLMTKKGAKALNLQFAHIAIIIDKPYNPAILKQMMARIRRFGQEKEVIYYVLNSDSVAEFRKNMLINHKTELARMVIDSREGDAEAIMYGEQMDMEAVAERVMLGGA